VQGCKNLAQNLSSSQRLPINLYIFRIVLMRRTINVIGATRESQEKSRKCSQKQYFSVTTTTSRGGRSSKSAMSEAEGVDPEAAAMSLRTRLTPGTKSLTQCSPGELAMRAAYSYLDGTHESPSEAAKEYCCQRQHVHYYVRKLVSQGVSRSDTASSGRTSSHARPTRRMCCRVRTRRTSASSKRGTSSPR